MTSGAVRRDGVAGMLAAAAFVLSAICFQFFSRPDVGGDPGEHAYRVATIAAYVGALVATLGIGRAHAGRPRFGAAGWAGAVATATGYGVFTVITVIALVQEAEPLMAIRLPAAVLLLAGSALLGVMVLRAQALPWWCGGLLVVAFPLGDVADELLFPTAENVLLALLWGSVGAALLSRSRSTSPGLLRPETARVG